LKPIGPFLSVCAASGCEFVTTADYTGDFARRKRLVSYISVLDPAAH